MKHLFDLVPHNFFSPLSSIDKELYSDILFLIYLKCEEKNSYTFIKEELIDIIENFFLEHNTKNITDSDEILKNPRDKATYIFRKLKSCGWLDTEYGENQQIIINLEDYAIAFLNTYITFDESNRFELSSHVYGIYQSMKTFEINNAYLTLTDIQQRGKNLINRLRSLNSNIKKYIKKVTQLENISEVEQLKKILDDLLGEYKENIIDKAYYYMKTNDNPIKYKIEFHKLCQERRNELNQRIIIDQIMTKDNCTEEEAIEKYENLITYLENIFENAINIMKEIDRKNTKYLNVAIGRIKIILNNDTNIEGLLLNILKNHSLLNTTDLNLNITNIKNINTNSLYTPKRSKQITSTAFTNEEPINEEMEQLLKQQFEKRVHFSKTNIINYVNKLLSTKNKLTSNDFNLTNKDEYIKLILIFIYSDELNSNYKIKFKDEEKINDFILPKFTIERNDKNV